MVAEEVPGSRLVVVAEDPGYRSSYEYQFTPFDGGTEVALFMSIETTGPLRLIEPFMWSIITRWVERDLAALDSALERERTQEGETEKQLEQPAPSREVGDHFDAIGQTSRAFLGDVVDNLSEAILLFSDEGRIFYANHAVERTLGIPPSAVLGRRYDDPVFSFCTIDGESLAPTDTPVARVLRTGKPVVDFEYAVGVNSKPQLTVSENAVPLFVGDEPAGVAVTLRDISERVRVERELRESEERFKAILEQTEYGIMIAAPDGEVLVYNDAMERMTGRSREDVRARGWLESAFPDQDERRVMAEHSRKALGGELPYLEAPYEHPDGRTIWLSYSSSPIELHGKRYLFLIISDVTEHRRTESQVRYQSRLLAEVRNAVISTDREGRIQYVNDEAERLFGRTRERLLGSQVMNVLHPTADQEQHGVMRTVMELGRWEGEASFVRPDGVRRPILLSLGMLTDDQGEFEGFVGVAVDITDIKAAEEALQEKDRDIRQAYVDIFGAVTGGKLVLMTKDELAAALGEPLEGKRDLNPDSLADSRRIVAEAMADAGIEADPEAAVVAYGEAATNALKHAHGGEYGVFSRDGRLQVAVFDSGGGIDFRLLPKATLLAGFSSTQTLGMGFTIMLDLAERVLLSTGSTGTHVVLEFTMERSSVLP